MTLIFGFHDRDCWVVVLEQLEEKEEEETHFTTWSFIKVGRCCYCLLLKVNLGFRSRAVGDVTNNHIYNGSISIDLMTN